MEGWAATGACRGIEYRHPLLDRRILEFALSLPPAQEVGPLADAPCPGDGAAAGGLLASEQGGPSPGRAVTRRFHPGVYGYREDIAARATLPERERYLDIACLLDSLDADHIRAGVANQSICNAL